MKNTLSLFLACASTLFASAAFAEDAPFVDLRPTTYRGTVTKILTPTTVEIATERDGRTEMLTLRLADIQAGNGADGQCHRTSRQYTHHKNLGLRPQRSEPMDAELKYICKVLSKTLKGETVGIEISQWNTPTTGYLSLGDSIVNFDLIANGEYRVDYTQSRSAHLVLLEKEARCKRVGSWAAMLGNKIEDMKCQE